MNAETPVFMMWQIGGAVQGALEISRAHYMTLTSKLPVTGRFSKAV